MRKSGAAAGWTVNSAYGLAILTLIYTLNYADRQILGLVLPLIKQEMHLSDVSIGLITGFVFVLFYSIMGVPIARLADRSNRRNILAIGLAFWSLMTSLSGLVANVWQLAAARFLMGAGEATCVAPSTSIVSDMFDKTHRPAAIAILTAGSSLSALFFFPLIGWLAQEWGWRACFMVPGVLGLVLATLLVLTVPEPDRSTDAASKAAQDSAGATARFLASSRTYVLTVVAGAFIGVSLYASQVWHPSFLARVHHMSLVQIGSSIGIVRGLAGLVGAVLGGLATARLAQIDDRWRLWLPGLVCILALPSELVFLLSPSIPMAMVGLLLYHLLTAAHLGPVYAVCQGIARPAMRATATAVFLLSANLFGQVIGPLAVGYLNDRWAAAYGPDAIRYSLILGGVCAFVGGVLLVLGAQRLGHDTGRAEA